MRILADYQNRIHVCLLMRTNTGERCVGSALQNGAITRADNGGEDNGHG